MLNTIATLLTGAALMTAPIMNTTNNETDNARAEVLKSGFTEMSHVVSLTTSIEELELIKAEAESAGLAFNYKKRGVVTRLVIDLVMDTHDGYELERIVVKEVDEAKVVKWTVNEKGEAVALMDGPITEKAEF
jgi:hypothetical protein